jgi:hypothetical protein
MSKPPTRVETAFGLLAIVGGLVFVGRCVTGGPEPTAAPKCETELDCRLAANTARMSKGCAAAANAKRHADDQEFDLARGLQSGTLSASKVRSETGTLAVRRQIAADSQAECDAAREEAYALGDEAVRVVRAREKAAQARQ